MWLLHDNPGGRVGGGSSLKGTYLWHDPDLWLAVTLSQGRKGTRVMWNKPSCSSSSSTLAPQIWCRGLWLSCKYWPYPSFPAVGWRCEIKANISLYNSFNYSSIPNIWYTYLYGIWLPMSRDWVRSRPGSATTAAVAGSSSLARDDETVWCRSADAP